MTNLVRRSLCGPMSTGRKQHTKKFLFLYGMEGCWQAFRDDYNVHPKPDARPGSKGLLDHLTMFHP